MRLTTDDPNALDYDVYFNGVEQSQCIVADEEAGYIEIMLKPEERRLGDKPWPGETGLTSSPGAGLFFVRRIHGEVKISEKKRDLTENA